MTDTRGRGLLHVQIDIDPAHEEEFNRWYNEEHFPMISGFWGVLEGRRFRAVVELPGKGRLGDHRREQRGRAR